MLTEDDRRILRQNFKSVLSSRYASVVVINDEPDSTLEGYFARLSFTKEGEMYICEFSFCDKRMEIDTPESVLYYEFNTDNMMFALSKDELKDCEKREDFDRCVREKFFVFLMERLERLREVVKEAPTIKEETKNFFFMIRPAIITIVFERDREERAHKYVGFKGQICGKSINNVISTARQLHTLVELYNQRNPFFLKEIEKIMR